MHDVLIVEDEPLVAQDLAYIVSDLGHRVVGPCRSVAQALQVLDEALPDLALLDVNVADGQIFPVADRLQQCGVPMVFCSAHVVARDLDHRYPQCGLVTKPYAERAIQEALAAGIATRAAN